MRYKITYANYDKDNGVSMVTIATKFGNFTGYAKLHPDDKPYENSYRGCRYAETKALIKALKARRKELIAKISEDKAVLAFWKIDEKAITYGFVNKRLNKNLEEKTNIENAISQLWKSFKDEVKMLDEKHKDENN